MSLDEPQQVFSALSPDDVAKICADALQDDAFDGQRVLVLIPDHTRSCPLDKMFARVCAELQGRVRQLDVMIALGTHPPLTEDMIYRRVGITAQQHRGTYPDIRFFNHAWNDPDQLVNIGQLTAAEIRDLTDDRFAMDINVTVNRKILDYDILLILGPVFPHEVVGFSGGNKYIFPGIGGPELLNFFHWLGAVISNPDIIGRRVTPVRQVVDRAAAMVPIARRAFCMVVREGDLAGLFYGTPEAAWAEAATLSDRLHIRYTGRTYHTVLSCAPAMYDELWVGAKCMYKLEPVVADGGRLIIYAPHIREVATAHNAVLKQIGYHIRDYFLARWDEFKHHPWGVLAHATHVKGIGTYENGVESPRIEVILATGIPESVCRQINLGYLDPATVNPDDYRGREDQGVLLVPQAGEILYRIHPEPGG